MSLLGLVLAGGEGSRLASEGVTTPKAVVPIGGRPLVQWTIAGLRRAGVTEVTVALRDDAARWIEASGEPAVTDAATLVVATPSSLHTLVEALRALPPGPVLCTMVDTLLPESDWAAVGATMRADVERGADAAILTTAVGDDESPLHVTITAGRRITGFPEDALFGSGQVTGGVYLLSPRARQHAVTALETGTSRIRGYLRSLVAAGYRLTAVPVAESIDLDHATDLARAVAWADVGRLAP